MWKELNVCALNNTQVTRREWLYICGMENEGPQVAYTVSAVQRETICELTMK